MVTTTSCGLLCGGAILGVVGVGSCIRCVIFRVVFHVFPFYKEGVMERNNMLVEAA